MRALILMWLCACGRVGFGAHGDAALAAADAPSDVADDASDGAPFCDRTRIATVPATQTLRAAARSTDEVVGLLSPTGAFTLEEIGADLATASAHTPTSGSRTALYSVGEVADHVFIYANDGSGGELDIANATLDGSTLGGTGSVSAGVVADPVVAPLPDGMFGMIAVTASTQQLSLFGIEPGGVPDGQFSSTNPITLATSIAPTTSGARLVAQTAAAACETFDVSTMAVTSNLAPLEPCSAPVLATSPTDAWGGAVQLGDGTLGYFVAASDTAPAATGAVGFAGDARAVFVGDNLWLVVRDSSSRLSVVQVEPAFDTIGLGVTADAFDVLAGAQPSVFWVSGTDLWHADLCTM